MTCSLRSSKYLFFSFSLITGFVDANNSLATSAIALADVPPFCSGVNFLMSSICILLNTYFPSARAGNIVLENLVTSASQLANIGSILTPW